MKVFEVLEEGRLKSKSYKKSYKAAKASGRRRKKKLRDDVNETTSSSIAAVSGSVGTVQSRNMYNSDGTMKNGVEFDNLLGGKKKSKKKKKTA